MVLYKFCLLLNSLQNGNRTKYLCHVCGKKYSKALKLTAHLCAKHEFKKPSGHTRFRYLLLLML